MHILLVDDEIAFNKLRGTIAKLTNLGHSVKAVSNGEDALAYIKEKHFIIDLILMDELLSVTGTHTSGAILGQAISELYPCISLVLFTAAAINYNKAVQVWTECGFSDIVDKDHFSDNVPFFLNRILNLKSVIQKIGGKKSICDNIIIQHFSSLSTPERNALLTLLESKQIEEVQKQIIDVEGKPYTLGEMLSAALFYDYTQPISIHLKQYLKRTKRDHTFQGLWIKPTIQQHLAKYYLLPVSEYEIVKRDINIKAFDMMLNIMHIQNLMNDNDSINKNFALNYRNHQISATNSCENERKGYQYFKDKLVCRRVAIAFSELVILNSYDEFEKIHLAALLRHGDTRVLRRSNDPSHDIESAGFKPTTVFSTHLGLTTNLSTDKFENDEEYILFEERQWINTYGIHASDMFIFLHSFNFPKNNKNFEAIKFQPPESFTDFTEFKTYVTDLKLRLNHEDKKHVDTYISVLADQLPQLLTEIIKTKVL